MKPSLARCPWVDLDKPDYIVYHDEEWGVPVHDDRRLFEFLPLESAQAGLSWYTVLQKRNSYQTAFDDLDPERVARYDDHKIEALLQNPGIIRNRRKVQAAVNSAWRFRMSSAPSMPTYGISWTENRLSMKSGRWKTIHPTVPNPKH